MKKHHVLGSAAGVVAAGAAVAAAGYAAFAGSSWLRFGRPAPARAAQEQDPLLDGFIQTYDVVERHHVMVEAPAAVTLECARNLDINAACLTRAIFSARELIMQAERVPTAPGGLLPVLRGLGWGILVEQPGHEIVLGAITR